MLKKCTYEDGDHGRSPHKHAHLVFTKDCDQICILLRTATLITVLINTHFFLFSEDYNQTVTLIVVLINTTFFVCVCVCFLRTAINRIPHNHNLMCVFSEDCTRSPR